LTFICFRPHNFVYWILLITQLLHAHKCTYWSSENCSHIYIILFIILAKILYCLHWFVSGLIMLFIGFCTLHCSYMLIHAQIEFLKTVLCCTFDFLFVYSWPLLIWDLLISCIILCILIRFNIHMYAQNEILKTLFSYTLYYKLYYIK